MIPYTRFRVFIDLISYYVFPRIVEESYIKNNALDEAIFYSNILNNIDNNFFSSLGDDSKFLLLSEGRKKNMTWIFLSPKNH